MQEILSGGYAVEYICRVSDETDGKESIPETATMAETNLNGKAKSGSKNGKKSAKDASETKTDAYWNAALQVAMPVLNGFSDGVAGQVIGKTKQVLNLTKVIAAGAGAGAIAGAAAPLAAWGVSEMIKAFQNAKAKNDALADSLDANNFQRQIAGLDKINYTRSGLTGKVRMEETR